MKKVIIFFCVALLLTACGQETRLTHLRCEYMENPLGIDAVAPRFTWEIESTAKNVLQQSYRLRIATSEQLLKENNPDIWLSEKIQSSSQHALYANAIPLEAHKKYYWNVTIWDSTGKECTSDVATFETAKMSATDWSGNWITDGNDKEFEPAPLFRKTFDVQKEIESARVYVSGTGYYLMFVNGNRVGRNYLDPGYTHFDKRILYVTHDVTDLLQQNGNAMAVVLGNGWYNCQSRAVWDFEKARWRNRPRFICELRITYTDGTVETIKTDESWKTNTGAYVYNNIYSGDEYDARLEEPGWNTTGFDDSHWNAVTTVESPTEIFTAQQMPAIRVVKELVPVGVQSFGDTVHVFDFGENIAGLCSFKVKGEAGTTFLLKHGELLKTNGRLEQGNISIYYHPQRKGETIQTDKFILRGTGEEEIFEPQFSYHGFQYVEIVSDKPVALSADNLTALFIHTDIPQVGNFNCSNELLNKIWKATNQSYRGNLHSIPTDCPQREKNGWTADAHVAIDLALLNFDGITLYEKWMNDMIDNQREDGVISGIVPSASWGYGTWPGPVWDAVLFIIPNALYEYYGETRSIEKLYPTLEKYMEYLRLSEVDGGLNFGLGDWVFYKAQTPNDYTSTMYYYLDNKLMARFASLIGKDGQAYAKKAEQLKQLINERYFNAETGVYANGTQTAQALALYMNIVPQGKEQLVADHLHKIVTDNNYFLDFGLLGSKTVPAMLAKYGYVEDAYKMATKTEAPSWGYWVETQGYTTLAETWTLSPEFRDASINHVFMGDISAWMYNVLAGINLDTEHPAFSNIIIKPHFVKDLTYVTAEYNSVKGMIKSGWERKGNIVHLSVTIPSGATATIYADKEYKVGSGTYTFKIKE